MATKIVPGRTVKRAVRECVRIVTQSVSTSLRIYNDYDLTRGRLIVGLPLPPDGSGLYFRLLEVEPADAVDWPLEQWEALRNTLKVEFGRRLPEFVQEGAL